MTTIRVFFITAFMILNCSKSIVIAQGSKKSFKVNGREVEIKVLNRQIEEILQNTGLPGLSFALIEQNKIVFYNTYGYKQFVKKKDGKLKPKGKVNDKTVFEACSLSKTFFAFAVHQLVDQGVLNLDIPLYQYLAHTGLEHDERYKKITARMVLSHSSGIENWKFYNNPSVLEILSEPGSEYVYSGEGYEYLAKVVEKLSGKSIDTYMNELVYEPLNLKKTFTYFTKRGPRNYSIGHNSFRQPLPKEKNEIPKIASNISTTAEDYAKLLISFFNDRYLSKTRRADLVTPGTTIGDGIFYGPAFMVGIKDGDTLLVQNGNNGSFKGMGCYSLSRKSGLVMFVNGERGEQILNALDQLTIQLNIFKEEINQYPNVVLDVLSAYNNNGYTAALNTMKMTLEKNKNSVSKNHLEDLGYLFLDKEPDFSTFIAQEFLTLYPSSKEAIVLHGSAMMRAERFDEAIVDFKKAKQLDSSAAGQLDELISQCSKQIEKKNKNIE